MSPRLFLLCVLWLLPSVCLSLAGQTSMLSLDSVTAADDIEGYWELTAGGAVIEFRQQPGRDGAYDIFMIESPDYAIEAGTPIGSMKATAVAGKFDAVLSSDPRRGVAAKNRRFIFDITDGRMRMSSYKVGKSVRLYRLIPYLFRVGVRDADTRPDGIDGAIRIAPPAPSAIIL